MFLNKAEKIWNLSLNTGIDREGDIEIEDDEITEKEEIGEKTPDLDEDVFKDREDDFALPNASEKSIIVTNCKIRTDNSIFYSNHFFMYPD